MDTMAGLNAGGSQGLSSASRPWGPASPGYTPPRSMTMQQMYRANYGSGQKAPDLGIVEGQYNGGQTTPTQGMVIDPETGEHVTPEELNKRKMARTGNNGQPLGGGANLWTMAHGTGNVPGVGGPGGANTLGQTIARQRLAPNGGDGVIPGTGTVSPAMRVFYPQGGRSQ